VRRFSVASPDLDTYVQGEPSRDSDVYLAPVSVPGRPCRGPLRHSGGLLLDSEGLLVARDVVLTHDVRIARRDATPAVRIRVNGSCFPVLVECRAGS